MTSVGCSICHEPFADERQPVITSCGHVFDKLCIEDWMRRSQTCPTCRQQTSMVQLKKVNFAFLPNIPDNETIAELQIRLEEAEMREAICQSEVEDVKKQLEGIKIENETLIEDIKSQKEKLNDLQKMMDHQSMERAKAMIKLMESGDSAQQDLVKKFSSLLDTAFKNKIAN